MKKLAILSIGLAALALPCLAGLVGNNVSHAKADTEAATTVYGSWADNEGVVEQVKGDSGWWVAKRDGTFTLNGVEWTYNFGRTRVYGEGRSYFQLLTSAAGEENSILNYDEVDNPVFYALGNQMLEDGKVEFGNQLSAVYSSPIVITEDLNLYYRVFDRGWAFVYFEALEDIYYDADEDGTNESILYEEGHWYPLTHSGEAIAIGAENAKEGTGTVGEFNEGAVHVTSAGNWKFSYIKGHTVRVAIALYHWSVAQGEDAVDLGIYDVVVNSTAATAAYMNELAGRAPNTENVNANVCNWIAQPNNYFSNTFKSVQYKLTEDGVATLAETAIESEHTSYTTALDLLNYFNLHVGNKTLGTNFNYLPTNNPTTLIVLVTVLAVALGLGGYIFFKKRKLHA